MTLGGGPDIACGLKIAGPQCAPNEIFDFFLRKSTCICIPFHNLLFRFNLVQYFRHKGVKAIWDEGMMSYYMADIIQGKAMAENGGCSCLTEAPGMGRYFCVFETISGVLWRKLL